MNDILTWGAVIAAGGSIVAIITFWMNRGKAEAEALATAQAAHTMATAALGKTEMLSETLAQTRIEFARDYATHKDLAAAEHRMATVLEDLRTALRGMNDRLDRVIENHSRNV